MTQPRFARPGVAAPRRALQFIWIVEASDALEAEGLRRVNDAVRSALPGIRLTSASNPHVSVSMRVLQFGAIPSWTVSKPEDASRFEWPEIEPSGGAALGAALRLLSKDLSRKVLNELSSPPVLLLISRGRPSDDFQGGMRRLMSSPAGRAAVRLAIAATEDSDRRLLAKFIANPDIPVTELSSISDITVS